MPHIIYCHLPVFKSLPPPQKNPHPGFRQNCASENDIQRKFWVFNLMVAHGGPGLLEEVAVHHSSQRDTELLRQFVVCQHRFLLRLVCVM